MKKFVRITLLVMLCMAVTIIPVVTAIDDIGTVRRSECIDLYQTCPSCTYVNLTSIKYPNMTLYTLNGETNKSDITFTYEYCGTDTIGDYLYTVKGNKDGSVDSETFKFKVTEFGDEVNTSQGLLLIAEGILIALFFGMGRVFDKKRWKLKMGFDVITLLLAVVLTNSIRIVAAQSSNLTIMGESMFIGAIVIFLLMIAYMLILMTIEVVQYFKKENRNKWEMDTNVY